MQNTGEHAKSHFQGANTGELAAQHTAEPNVQHMWAQEAKYCRVKILEVRLHKIASAPAQLGKILPSPLGQNIYQARAQ